MIGFGELRKFSIQWQVDVTHVERVYATDWLLKGIFDHTQLSQSLVLRGGAALRYVYSAEFPAADNPEFLLIRATDDNSMYDALTTSLTDVANASGLKFSLSSYGHGSAKIEYTGPLGRRSAAQPRVTLSVVPGQPRLDPARLPLVHPFSDNCNATIAGIALDEFVGEQIAALVRVPRARDVYNFWFAATKLRGQMDLGKVKGIAQQIALEKKTSLPSEGLFDPKQRATLERAWDNALREVRGHPSFAQAERDLTDMIKSVFAN